MSWFCRFRERRTIGSEQFSQKRSSQSCLFGGLDVPFLVTFGVPNLENGALWRSWWRCCWQLSMPGASAGGDVECAVVGGRARPPSRLCHRCRAAFFEKIGTAVVQAYTGVPRYMLVGLCVAVGVYTRFDHMSSGIGVVRDSSRGHPM